MSDVNFFSNSLIVLSGKECQTTSSLSGERSTVETKFDVPTHTVRSKNLLIFLDGRLQVIDRDYEDINSFEVRFTKDIPTTVDFQSILIATGGMDSDCEIRLLESEF